MRLRIGIFAAAFVVLIAVLDPASAYRRLVITGDNFIKSVYMANTSYTSKLRHGSNVRKYDSIIMPPNATLIAVEAKNAGGWAGILSYETGVGAAFSDWKCAAYDDVPSDQWYDPDYLNAPWWQPAKKFGLTWHRNENHAYIKQARKHQTYRWIWTGRTHDKYSHVVCRLALCDDNCLSCKLNGPGHCDPGMCKYGSSFDNTGNERCNHKCGLEIKVYGPEAPGSKPPASVKVTDLVTNTVRSWPGDFWNITAEGYYGGILDMTTCSIISPIYSDSTNDLVTGQISGWATDGQHDQGIAININLADASSGLPKCDFLNGVFPPGCSFAPLTTVSELIPAAPQLYIGSARLYSARFTGVTYGNFTMYDVRVIN